MKLISYPELSKLRLKEFFGESIDPYVEESGMGIIVGLGGFEQLGETIFGWKQGQPYQTCEISLDLINDPLLTEEIATRILGRLGLNAYRGMSATEVRNSFGYAHIDRKNPNGTSFLRFACGIEDTYLIGCRVDDRSGLLNLFIARKDFCDQDASL